MKLRADTGIPSPNPNSYGYTHPLPIYEWVKYLASTPYPFHRVWIWGTGMGIQRQRDLALSGMGQSSGIFPRPDEAELLPFNEKRWDPFTRLAAFFYLTWPGESSMLLYLGDKIDRDIIVAYGCKAFCMSKLHWGKMAPLLCALINSSKQNRLKFASSLNAKDHPITTWCSRLHMFSWFLCPSLNSGELIKDGYTICEQESKK